MSNDDLVREELFRILIDAALIVVRDGEQAAAEFLQGYGMCEYHAGKLACEVAREFKAARRELDELEAMWSRPAKEIAP